MKYQCRTNRFPIVIFSFGLRSFSCSAEISSIMLDLCWGFIDSTSLKEGLWRYDFSLGYPRSLFSDRAIPGCLGCNLFMGLIKQSKMEGVFSIDVSVLLGYLEGLSYLDLGRQKAKSFLFLGTLIVSIRLFWLEYVVSSVDDLGTLWISNILFIYCKLILLLRFVKHLSTTFIKSFENL